MGSIIKENKQNPSTTLAKLESIKEIYQVN